MKPDEQRKEYVKPEIIHELVLETKAGSTLGLPIDPLKIPGAPEG